MSSGHHLRLVPRDSATTAREQQPFVLVATTDVPVQFSLCPWHVEWKVQERGNADSPATEWRVGAMDDKLRVRGRT